MKLIGSSITSRNLDLKLEGVIENVTPEDYNYDGKLDLLVTRNVSSTRFVEIYYQGDDGFTETPAVTYLNSGQPTAFDLNGDMQVDLIFNMIDQDNRLSPYVIEKQKLNLGYLPRPLSTFAFESAEHSLAPSKRALTSPHSVAFVDLNKDCLADLFLTTQDEEGNVYFEVWLNMKNGMYCVVQETLAPKGADRSPLRMWRETGWKTWSFLYVLVLSVPLFRKSTSSLTTTRSLPPAHTT